MDKLLDYEYLNSCRSLSGLTNKAIAEAAHTSESTISKFFSAHMKDPTAFLLCAVCDVIGASVDRAYGIVKPIDQALTEPAPSIPAIVTDAVQSLPPLLDAQEVAQEVAKAVTESPLVPDPIDPHKLAQDIASCLPKPQPAECEHCRTAKLYEASIARQSKLIGVLFAAFGSLVALLVVRSVYLLTK